MVTQTNQFNWFELGLVAMDNFNRDEKFKQLGKIDWFFNDKLTKFIVWAREDMGWEVFDPLSFDMYRKMNKEPIEDLTPEEVKALKDLNLVLTLNRGLQRCAAQAVKMMLENQYGWKEKTGIDINRSLELIKFDTKGLGDDYDEAEVVNARLKS